MKPQAIATIATVIVLLVLFALTQESDNIVNDILQLGQNLAKSMEDAIASSLVGVLFFSGSTQIVFAGEATTETTEYSAPVESKAVTALDAAIASLEGKVSLPVGQTANLIDIALKEHMDFINEVNAELEASKLSQQEVVEPVLVEEVVTPEEVRAETEAWISGTIEAEDFLGDVVEILEVMVEEPVVETVPSVVQQEIVWEFRTSGKSRAHSAIEVWKVSGEPACAGKLEKLLTEAKLNKKSLYSAFDVTAPTQLAVILNGQQWRTIASKADEALKELLEA